MCLKEAVSLLTCYQGCVNDLKLNFFMMNYGLVHLGLLNNSLRVSHVGYKFRSLKEHCARIFFHTACNKHPDRSNIGPSLSVQTDRPLHPLDVRTLGLAQLKLVCRNTRVTGLHIVHFVCLEEISHLLSLRVLLRIQS